MKKGVKILIVLLLIGDLLLAAMVFGPFEPGEKILAQEPETEALATEEITLATEQIVAPETTAPYVAPETTAPTELPPTPTVSDEEFILTFVGDCTLGATPDSYYAPLGFIKTVEDDYSYPFRYVASYFAEDDFTMANLEGVLQDRGVSTTNSRALLGKPEYAKILSQNSVEVVTLANNHTLDYGKKGYESTVASLEAEKVAYVENDSILLVQTRSGLTIGVYAMTYANMDEDNMRNGISMLKNRGAEVIIVAAHWGAELHYEPIDDQVRLAHAAIDAGAHIVYGSHPHVLQPIEEYGNGIIYYSLGNFSFGGHSNPKDYDTAMIRQQVIRKADGTSQLGGCTPIPACVSGVSDYNNFQPMPYEEGSDDYQRTMDKLFGTQS